MLVIVLLQSDLKHQRQHILGLGVPLEMHVTNGQSLVQVDLVLDEHVEAGIGLGLLQEAYGPCVLPQADVHLRHDQPRKNLNCVVTMSLVLPLVTSR